MRIRNPIQKMRPFVVSGFVLLLFCLFITEGLAKSENVGGSQYQGSQNPQDGPGQYRFANNVQVNLTVNNQVRFGMNIDPSLSDRLFGMDINASEALMLNLSMQGTFDHQPGGQLRKYGQGQNQPSTDTTTDNSGTSTHTTNPPGPHSIETATTKARPIQNQVDLGSSGSSVIRQVEGNQNAETTDTAVEIVYTYNTYFVIDLNQSADYLAVYSFLDSTWGLSPDTTYQWAIYDNASQSWYLLDTTTVDGVIQAVIPETSIGDTQFIVTLVELTPAAPISFWKTPLGITVIVIGILAVLVGLMMTKAEYRSYLLNRFLPIEKGPHRLTMEDVLENENRDTIIRLILEQPGIHFNELLRQVGLSAGNLAWHLDILETFKVVRKERVGQYLVYYPYLDKNPISKLDPKLQKSKTTLEILQLIDDHPGIYQNQIAKRMDLDHKTVNYHLNKLIEADVIKVDQVGRSKGFFPKDIPKEDPPSSEDPRLTDSAKE